MNDMRWKARWRLILPVSLVVAGWAAGCATVPGTDRRQLALVPDQQLYAMSTANYEELVTQLPLSQDQDQVATVKRVGERLQQAAQQFMQEANQGEELKGYAWEYNLFQANSVNAFAMPGGKVGVFSGILPITQDETGLAVVVGHEIAHALANHGGERMSQVLVAQLGGLALAEALRQKPAETKNLFLALYGLGANLGVLLPYSRLQEGEADRIGLQLMARAGYDPRQAVPFWQRMAERGGPQPPVFLSTHPDPQNRIAAIEKYVQEALPYYEQRGR